MSSFECKDCGTFILDSTDGYVTGCKHYPIEEVPKGKEVEYILDTGWGCALLLVKDGKVIGGAPIFKRFMGQRINKIKSFRDYKFTKLSSMIANWNDKAKK